MIKFQFSIVSWTGARAGSLPLSSEIETERRLRFAMIAGLQSFIHCYTILIVVEICSTDVAVHPVLCDLYIANSLISTLAIHVYGALKRLIFTTVKAILVFAT